MLTDKDTIKNLYYKTTDGLETRKSIWRTFWVNKISYNNWVISKINEERKAHAKVLDIGCWMGDFLQNVHQRFPHYELHWLDVSEVLVDLASKLLWDDAIIQHWDIDIIDYWSRSFDIITCNHLLHHLPNVSATLENLCWLLAPEWCLFIVVGVYDLDAWLNKMHYEALRELNAPSFLCEKQAYSQIQENFLDTLFWELSLKFSKDKYKNGLHIDSVDPCMEYYASWLMFRNSKWPLDSRLEDGFWDNLYNLIEQKVFLEVERSGYLYHPGDLILYKISNTHV